jgi:hypothetical protein
LAGAEQAVDADVRRVADGFENGNHAGLPNQRTQRDSSGHQLFGQQARRHRAIGGASKAARHPQQGGNQEEQRQGNPAIVSRDAQNGRACHLQQDRSDRHLAPIDMIRHPAGYRRQQEQRQKLHQADKPELRSGGLGVHRQPRGRIGLPGNDEQQAILADDRCETCNEVEPKIAHLQRMGRDGSGLHIFSLHAARPGGNRLNLTGRLKILLDPSGLSVLHPFPSAQHMSIGIAKVEPPPARKSKDRLYDLSALRDDDLPHHLQPVPVTSITGNTGALSASTSPVRPRSVSSLVVAL